MQLLSLNFMIYTIAGTWRPLDWNSSGIKLLYDAYSIFNLSLLYFMVFTQLMDIILVVDNIDDFATNSLIFMSLVSVCCKSTVIILRRDSIINLVEMLLTEPCKPQNADEMAIQTKLDNFIRLWSIRYMLLASCSVMGVTVGSILNIMNGNLPYRVWLPYNSNIPVLFWITSIQQIISLIYATVVNVGTETIVFGFILQTCAQIEIFQIRLEKYIIYKTTQYAEDSLYLLNKRKDTIAEHIRHHLQVYHYAKTLNIIFNPILFVQFFGSMLVLCTSVYYISSHLSDSGTAAFLVYTFCMFVQIYLYCWSGNEVILKSMEIGNIIYNKSNWPELSVNEKKNLLMVMMRSKIPIIFRSSFLISLSLQSYSNLLKTSYSAFNLLQQS